MANDTSIQPTASGASVVALQGDMYHLLAVGFLDPTRELASIIVDGTFSADVADIADGLIAGLGLAVGGPRGLADSAGRLAGLKVALDSEVLYHDLAVEYTRLFIGPKSPAVSPYETIHVDSEPDVPGLLMVSPSARAVLAAYREAGLDMASGFNEPPDHIATEFEFAYYTCTREVAAWQTGDMAEAARWHDIRRTFERGHLACWGLEFAQQVEKKAQQPFYSALAALARAFLSLERGLD